MSDPLAEAIRAGALAALRKRIAAIGQRIAWATSTVEKDGHETTVVTSEGAHAARIKSDFEAIVRDVETIDLGEVAP